MATSSNPYGRGQLGANPEAVGKRRLAKRNPSNSMLTALNTSTSTLNSSLPLRPSPASSRSDGLLSPVDGARSPIDPRQQSKVSLGTDSGSEDRQGGIRKKMSLTGSVLGKKPSLRLGLGPLRSQSEVSLTESPEERAQVLAQIKEKAEKDRTIAHEHAASCSAMGTRVPNHSHPIRRRSLLTPGLATRDASDPLRKPPADGQVERPTIGQQPPATAPLTRPPPSLSVEYRQAYANLVAPDPAPYARLAPLDLAAEDIAIGTPRSSTPSERDYGLLGTGLRITNGIASPNPSVGSGRWSNGSSIQRTYTMPEIQSSGPKDYVPIVKAPLKSRLYMIENADRSEDESDESNIHPAFRSKPPFAHELDHSALAQQHEGDMSDSPYDSSVDLNKPLPTPPGSNTKLPSKVPSTTSSIHSRSHSARPDLEYLRRESLSGDVNRKQEDLYDEALSLLDSIGSSRSNSSRPQLTSTTTTTTTFTTTTTPSSIAYTKATPAHETRTLTNGKPGVKTISTTGPITSTVRTTNGATQHIHIQTTPHSAGLPQIMYESPSTGNFPSAEVYRRAADQKGLDRAALIRNDDSGYSSSSYGSSQAQRTNLWEPDGSGGQSPEARTVGTEVAPLVETSQPHQSQPRSATRSRPSLSSASQSHQSGSYESKHAHSSSESATTLLSIRNAVTTPLSSNKRRLSKLRPTSLPPVERAPVQTQKHNYSDSIPPIPQDIAARHAQRSAEHPPLAHTVSNIRHTRQPSGHSIVPMSAPLKFASSTRPSDEDVSHGRPSIGRPAHEHPGNERPNKERRNSKGFFGSRLLKFGDTSKAIGSDSKPMPRSGSRAERRAASRQESRKTDFDEGEGAVLPDLHEAGNLYGSSPYDAAAPSNAWPGGDVHNPYRHPRAPRSRSAIGMSEAQASEINRIREQSRWGHSSDERMATVPEQRPTMPNSAPASEQYFEPKIKANPYSNASRNREWDRDYSEDRYDDHLYDSRTMAPYPSHSSIGTNWQTNDYTWASRFESGSGHGDRPVAAHRFSNKPTQPSPDLQSAEWTGDERDSGRSQMAPSSPITPRDGYEGDHDYARGMNGHKTRQYGEEAGYDRYGTGELGHGYEPGRYDGGFSYGYEPGRGVNGSAGTRGWHNETSRKNVGIGQQYGIDLTDVPIFVAPRMTT